MISFGNYNYIIYILLSSALVLLLYGGYLIWKRSVVRRLLSDPVLRDMMVKQSRAMERLKSVLLAAAILLFAFTMLRPQWGEAMREVQNEGVDLLVALDVSRSMRARDVQPSRLERAKDAINLMADSLRGDRVGLVLFAGDAFIQCPLTGDLGAFKMFLDAADTDAVAAQGTNIGAAMEMAYRVFHTRRRTSRNFVIITDGEDHEGRVEQSAAKFRDLDVAVYAVGIGRDGGDLIPLGADEKSADIYVKDSGGNLVRTKKNAGVLKTIARETGGDYIDITNSMSGVYKILRKMSQQTQNRYGTMMVKQRTERYQIFALLLILILSAEALLPGRRKQW
ncbi:MAG TPA: VWA domain-containing protein [Spirochaetota bacterium]|nr:VWA domain-containing protein [Spirochaetota bacterium]HQO01127.1 VWA domain-containing protein [Spirochaetota bacterium]